MLCIHERGAAPFIFQVAQCQLEDSKVSNSEQNQKDGTSGISVTETREKIYEPESFGNLPNEDAVIVYYKGKYIKAEKTYYFK